LRDGCTTSAAVLVLMVLSYCSPHRLPAPVAKVVRAQVPSFEHVFVVVEENENFSNVVGNTRDMPYLNHLAADYGLATNYYANTHPSINNYFILTAGRNGTRRPWIRTLSDLYPFDVEGENIASLLSEKGKTWKSYAEDLPLAGYVGDDRLPYLKRHNPFAYFANVRDSAAERENIVPFATFKRDLQNGSLPAYSFIVPDVYSDGHNDPATHSIASCGDRRALRDIDSWLRDNIDPLIKSRIFREGGLLLIVFDEACEDGPDADWVFDPTTPAIRGGGRVAALVVSSRTPPGTRSNEVYHHEAILRLSLRVLGIEQLPGLAASSPDMDRFFPKNGGGGGSP